MPTAVVDTRIISGDVTFITSVVKAEIVKFASVMLLKFLIATSVVAFANIDSKCVVLLTIVHDNSVTVDI